MQPTRDHVNKRPKIVMFNNCSFWPDSSLTGSSFIIMKAQVTKTNALSNIKWIHLYTIFLSFFYFSRKRMVLPNVFWRIAKNKFPQFVLQKANYLSGCGFSFLTKVNYMFLQSIHVFLFCDLFCHFTYYRFQVVLAFQIKVWLIILMKANLSY